MKTVHVGFGSYLAIDDIALLADATSKAMKRTLAAHVQGGGTVIDLSRGRRRKCILITKSGIWYLSTLNPVTISMRMEGNSE